MVNWLFVDSSGTGPAIVEAVGARVGAVEGADVGVPDGAALGDALGTATGCSLGAGVGLDDGALDGFENGANDGSASGASETDVQTLQCAGHTTITVCVQDKRFTMLRQPDGSGPSISHDGVG